jgi:hypothetical protein
MIKACCKCVKAAKSKDEGRGMRDEGGKMRGVLFDFALFKV